MQRHLGLRLRQGRTLARSSYWGSARSRVRNLMVDKKIKIFSIKTGLYSNILTCSWGMWSPDIAVGGVPGGKT